MQAVPHPVGQQISSYPQGLLHTVHIPPPPIGTFGQRGSTATKKQTLHFKFLF